MKNHYKCGRSPQEKKDRTQTSWRLRFIMTLFVVLSMGSFLHAQTLNTTIGSTGYTGTNSAGNGLAITFAIENSSSQSVILTDVGDWTNTTDNGETFSLYYSSTSLSGAPPTTYPATGWTLADQNTVSSITSTTLSVNNVISNMNLIIPANTSYRFALLTTGSRRYSGSGVGDCTPNTFSSSGIKLYVGDYQINSLYVGYGGTNNPRFFTGSVTFIPATACAGQPSAGTIPASLAVCPSTAFNITATGSTLAGNMVNQWQSRNPAGTGVWTNITGATSASYNSTGITSPTDYRYITTCTTSGLSDTTTVMTTTINPVNQCYCTPSGNSSTYSIEDFTTSGGGQNISNLASGYSPTGYGDFTAMTVSQNVGSPVSFTAVYPSNNTFGFKVWVDWNQNGSFNDPGEQVFSSTGYASTHSGVFTVPATALTGTTRMRIGNSYTPSTGPATACETGLSGEYEDYTFIVTVPTCYVPTGLTVSAIAATTATISWTAASPAPAGGYEYYLSTSSTAPTASTVATGTTGPGIVTKNLTALPANTMHYVYVRSVCTANDKSNWTIAQSFKTLCLPETAPWTYTVETQSGTASNSLVDDCWMATPNSTSAFAWNVAPNGTTPSSTTGPSSAHSGTKFFFTEASSGTTGAIAELLTPLVNVTSLTTPALEFYYHMFGAGMGKMYIEAYNGTTWTVVDSLIGQQQTTQTAPWLKKLVPLAGYTGNIQVKFRASRGTDYYGDMAIDDITIKEAPLSCSGTPTAGTITIVDSICTGVSFDLVGVDANQLGMTYQWQQSAAGANAWSNIAGANTAAYTLAAGTTVASDYRLILTCTNSNQSDTSNVETVTMKTGINCYCTPSGNSASYYINNFTTTGGAQNISNLASGYSTTGYGDFTGMTISQDLGSSVSFNADFVGGTFGFKVWVDWNKNGSFNDPGEEVFATTGYSSSHTGSFSVPATASIGTTRMRIGNSFTPSTGPATPCETGISGEFEDYSFTITAPSCVLPTGLTVSAVTSSTATISWTAASPAPAGGYEYYLSTTNTAPTASTVATGTTGAGITTKNLTLLTPNTPYYVWVRSVCSASNKSSWTLGQTFSTLCTTFMAPFTENLDGGVLPSCWYSTTTAGQTGANVFWKFTGAPDYNATPALNGRAAGTFAWVDASVPNLLVHDVTLTSPAIDLTPLTSGYVEFDWFKNNQQVATTPLSNNKLTVAVNDGSGWVNIWSDTSNSPVWRTIGIPLAASYSNATIQLRFIVDKDAFGVGDFYDDLLLDNIKVKEAPLGCSGTPTAGVITVADSICAGVDFDLTGVDANQLGMTYQWQQSAAGMNTWSNIAGANTAVYNLTNGTSVASDYRLILTCTNSNMSDTSNVETVNMKAGLDCYCTPSGNSASYYIDNFATTGANQNITNNGSGYSTNGYGDFTTMSVSQDVNGTVNFTADYMGGTFGFKVWVDWNKNGSFDDPGEEVFATSSYGSTHSGNFTVPANATIGSTRMRIGNSWTPSTGPANACVTGISGEYEDYTFVITGGAGCVNPIVNLGNDTTICAGNTLTLDAGNPGLDYLWSDNSTNQTLDVTASGTYSVTVTDSTCSTTDSIVVTVVTSPVVNLGGDVSICQGDTLTLDAGNPGANYLWNDNSTNQTLDVSAEGTYSVTVSNGACSASDTVMVNFQGLPTGDSIIVAVQNTCQFLFSVANASHTTTYSWNFGDGSAAATGATDTHQYTANSSYLVTVVISNDCGDSDTLTTTVTCSGVGIGDVDLANDALILYPNPTSDRITIENTSNLKMEYITVFNVLGQVVYQNTPQSAQKHQLNVANLASGLYTVRIKTNEGMMTRKFEILK